LLVNDGIQRRIAQLKADRAEKVSIDAAYVLRQAVKIHERCMQEVRPALRTLQNLTLT
jgi:phage terminase small subunit